MANSEEAFNIRLGYLDPKTQEIAKEELRETPEVQQAAIVELRTLLKGCPEIKYRDDDEFLIIFLRACHYYPESAFEKVNILYVIVIFRRISLVTAAPKNKMLKFTARKC